MRTGQILADKGRDVATVPPDATVAQAVAVLRERDVGALVVSSDGSDVVGILSERDVVRRLAREGGGVLDLRVRDVMAVSVWTCGPDTTVDDLMAAMTIGRFRHAPVVADGVLVGIVSIGDAVKVRMDELNDERLQLAAYIAGV
jgi:CBS domain-containing protein